MCVCDNDFSVIDSLRTFRALVTPRCDVITHVTRHTDDRYRNTTRFFTSAAQPPPSSSRDRVGDDVATLHDFDDVMPVSRTTFKLVLVCLDVVILLYRVTRVYRIVNRMRNYWSRDHRKYYEDDDDDDDDYWSAVMMTRECTRQNLSTTEPGGLEHVDDTLYQLSPSSSSSSPLSCPQSRVVCRLARSSYVGKVVLFVALVTSCHVTLQMIDSSQAPAHINLTSLASHSALSRLDSDVQLVYQRQRDNATTSFNDFVVDLLSHLSLVIQLIHNGHVTSRCSFTTVRLVYSLFDRFIVCKAVTRNLFPG